MAGSLIQDPEYIFLDEPSSGLDPIQIVEFKKLVRILGKTKTILFSSHVLQEIEELCDHVLILYKGKLISDHPLNSISQNRPCLILAKTDPETFKSFFRLPITK
ncbi:hypothetical protein LEP1GSC150_3601 [Leptospira interrogans serovar Copenhageni str. LT2050]|uniref:ABC transporter, ATP-binding domain protein n=1 Tax=Leptospira interrogans serovar Copenhageni str. LT2050 TaxID=1001598 RepID=M3HGJ1_LEPIT|nr:hypothetical protein LEP1GSC150_3601 [Leptospira interrogans serovar Copenhageni str. LT2050]